MAESHKCTISQFLHFFIDEPSVIEKQTINEQILEWNKETNRRVA